MKRWIAKNFNFEQYMTSRLVMESDGTVFIYWLTKV